MTSFNMVDIKLGDFKHLGYSFIIKEEDGRLEIVIPYPDYDIDENSFTKMNKTISSVMLKSYRFGRDSWSNLKSIDKDIDEKIVAAEIGKYDKKIRELWSKFDWNSAAKEAFLLGFCNRS